MSILQKQKQEDPRLGYARDFPPLIGRLANKLKERGFKVVATAGGVNPAACARASSRATYISSRYSAIAAHRTVGPPERQ